jgi:hypothetical protein
VLGGVRRKSGAYSGTMAYFDSGHLLSIYGNSLDHAIETIGSVDPNRPV